MDAKNALQVKRLALKTCKRISNDLGNISITALNKKYESIIPYVAPQDDMLERFGRSPYSSAIPYFVYGIHDAYGGYHSDLLLYCDEQTIGEDPLKYAYALVALYLVQYDDNAPGSQLVKIQRNVNHIYEAQDITPIDYFLNVCMSYMEVNYS